MSDFYKDRIELGVCCSNAVDEMYDARIQFKHNNFGECECALARALDNLNKAMEMVNGKLKPGVGNKTDG